MNRRLASLTIALIAALGLAALLAPLASAASPVWRVSISSQPTNFTPNYSLNEGGLPQYWIAITNIGSASPTGPADLTIQLPSGITEHGSGAQVIHDTFSGLAPGVSEVYPLYVDVGNLAPGSSATATLTASGGGAAASAQGSTTTPIGPDPLPFDFLAGPDGLAGQITDPDGSPVTQAGAHPFQVTIDEGFTSWQIGKAIGGFGELLSPEGGARDIVTTLPKGMIVNPDATPTRCVEAQLESQQCPLSSAVGIADLFLPFLGNADPSDVTALIYNMVPGAGEAAELGFVPGSVGYYGHLAGGVRAGDYALQATSRDSLALFGAQILGVRAQLWGDPSDPLHDAARAPFAKGGPSSVPAQSTPFLSLPSECRASQELDGDASSWSNPGVLHHRATTLADSNGNDIAVTGCNALAFAPTLRARPTTNLADSPSGLSVDLGVPQSEDKNVPSTAHLKDAVVTLPEGLVLNPSSANGLGACTPAQVGIDAGTGVANGDPVTCPDASKVGTVEVDTPLVPNPLVGAVYVAKPFDNPFDSLLAIYVTVDDPQTGVLIKLAGHVVADPQTGRLVTAFDNNPQLPFSDFKLSFKSGAHGILRTPSTCGSYSTTSQLTPWSYPDTGPPAAPSDNYSISQGPGGSCASNASQQPNSPSFDAGSASVVAGSYSPFVMHLSRADGDQQFASLTLSPPPGLLGKLAGTVECSDAALAAAASKSGGEEQANPSCPADSRLGTVTVGAGAGSSPYYTQGTAYLAGPHKGAPLSIAIVTPAVAGPYDLGTVVVRSAVNLDPTTAQITATSDPIPQILQGIPLDVRSIVLNLDKPNFTLNGTSCDPLAVNGSLLSSLNQSASLTERFQLGECGRLGFKPKLALRLTGSTRRGAHPALRAVLTIPRPGRKFRCGRHRQCSVPPQANIARAAVALPHSEFLDQGHIRTVCTRVQFAAKECPAASIYGYARAISPLVDYPLEGPVYLRSSSHNLPDLVAALHGPPSQPIEIDLDGRVDSIRGGIRNTFELVPDAPVSKFTLSMQGGRKGLLQNSTDICASVNRATALFDAQNGKTGDSEPVVGTSCPKRHKRHHRRHHR